MNYVDDILLNFQKDFYDFYEWNSEDEILHIRKIPLFKINNSDFRLFKYGIVRFDKDFMFKIYNKTEKFKKVKAANLNYVFLVSNGKETMAIRLNKSGINTYKSSLLLDEENEISDIAMDLNNFDIGYKIIKNSTDISFQTRREKETGKIIIQKLNHLYNYKDDEKLKYLYLECFNKTEKNITKIYNILKGEVFRHTKNQDIIYDFFKIIEEQK